MRRRGFLRRMLMMNSAIGLCYWLLLDSSAPISEPEELAIGPEEDWSQVTAATKTILVWNGADRFELESLGRGASGFRRARCPIDDCFLTHNHSTMPLERFDAIIFNMAASTSFRFPRNMARNSHQRYVLFSQEPPTEGARRMADFDGLFNWTMTYQHESDVAYIYGRVMPLATAPSPTRRKATLAGLIAASAAQGVNYAEKKTKLVAWFTSRCFTQSHREDYARRLAKHIDVDVFGRCSNQQCARNSTTHLSSVQCLDMVERHYKFYLSFENALCHDYVTEKFFDLLERRVVPVVLGGADYAALAPPHSFIDASQYSPRQLADYLRRLDADDRLYNEFFWWKPHYRVEGRYPFMAQRALCQLCRKLHTDGDVSVYRHAASVFSRQSQCRPPQWLNDTSTTLAAVAKTPSQ